MKHKAVLGSILLIFSIMLLFWACQTGDRKETLVRKSEEAIMKFYDQNPSYSVYAINVIKKIDSPFSRTLIQKALEGDDWDTRYASIMAAAELNDESLIPLVQKIFDTGTGVEKLQAALSLAKLGVEDTIPFLKENAVSKGKVLSGDVIEFLAGQGDDSFLPAMEEKLKSKEISDRNGVYVILGRIKAPWSLDMLKKALKKEWGADRVEVINAIGNVGEAAHAELLVPYINTRDLSLPTMFALGNLKNKDTAKPLKKFLKHKKKYARLYSAVALWRMDEEGSVKIIQKLFEETDPLFRAEFAKQLSTVEENDVLSYLASLGDDPDERVRKIVVQNLRDREDPSLIKILLTKINDPSYEVVVFAIDGVGMVGDREVLGDLFPLLENENGYIAISAGAAIINIANRHPSQG
jgi:HEAT repeat protein